MGPPMAGPLLKCSFCTIFQLPTSDTKVTF